MNHPEYSDFKSVKDYQKALKADKQYRSIEVIPTTNKNKIRNVVTRKDKNGLVKYKPSVTIDGKKKLATHLGYSKTTFKTLDEALEVRDKLEELRPNIKNNQHTINKTQPYTVKYAVQVYLEYLKCKEDWSFHSRVEDWFNAFYWKDLKEKKLGEITLDDLSFFWKGLPVPENHENLRGRYISNGSTHYTWSKNGAKGYLSILRRCVKFWKSQGFEFNVDLEKHSEIYSYISSKLSSKNRVKKPFWTTSEYEVFKDNLDTYISKDNGAFSAHRNLFRIYCGLLNETAMRPAEGLALSRDCIISYSSDGKPYEIMINWQLSCTKRSNKTGTILGLPKEGKSRPIFLNKKAAGLVQELLDMPRTEAYKDKKGNFEFLFRAIQSAPLKVFNYEDVKFHNKPIGHETMNSHWKKLKKFVIDKDLDYSPFKKIEGTSTKFYIFRYTWGTHHVFLSTVDKRAYSIREIKSHMGHEETSSSLNNYSHNIRSLSPTERDQALSYYKNEFGEILETEIHHDFKTVMEEYAPEEALQLILLMRQSGIRVEPSNSLNRIVLSDFTEEVLKIMFKSNQSNIQIENEMRLKEIS